MLSGIKKRDLFVLPESRLGWYVLLGTIPAGLTGIFLKNKVKETFNNPTVVALFLFGTACLLILAEVIGKKTRPLEEMNWQDSLWMGAFQAISIFPGISRSGSVISGGMISHFKRKDAARFSFLLAIPIMLAAGFLEFLDLLQIQELGSFFPVVLTGTVVAAVVGYLVITWMLNFLNQHSLYIFSAYCILLGSFVLAIHSLIPILSASAINQDPKAAAEIALPTSLTWLIPSINECNQMTSKQSFVYSFLVDTSQNEQTISIKTNTTDDSEKKYFVITKETYAVAVNRTNPISQLGKKQLGDIFSGRLTSWQQLIDECPLCINVNDKNLLPQNPIQPWVYPPASLLQRIIHNLYLEHVIISASANIASDGAAAAEAISMNPAAVTILPGHWLNDQLKAIAIIGIAEIQTQSPILVSVNEAEVTNLEPFIICMQKKLLS